MRVANNRSWSDRSYSARDTTSGSQPTFYLFPIFARSFRNSAYLSCPGRFGGLYGSAIHFTSSISRSTVHTSRVIPAAIAGVGRNPRRRRGQVA